MLAEIERWQALYSDGQLNIETSTLALFATELADDPADQAAIRAEQVQISFLDYDWRLNDLPSLPAEEGAKPS